MHYWLKEAIKNIVARCERGDILRTDAEAQTARETARAGRIMLLHDSTSNELAERWIDNHDSTINPR